MHDRWIQRDDALHGSFTFDDFKQAFAFMTTLADYAERVQHHPTWTNTYDRVSIVLTTHDAGNKVTQLDHAFAEEADRIFAQMKSDS